MNKPLVSVIIVNYNGRYLLPSCLKSVFQTQFPPDQLEVIVVDNNSTDDSVTFIQRFYPKVKLIESDQNLGFTGGNNLGFKHSSGKYIALLNSDTKVDPQWLIEMLKIFAKNKDSKVGIVSPKIYYDTPYLKLTIESNIVSKSDIDGSANFLPYGVLMSNVKNLDSELTDQIWYLSGFYPKNVGHITLRWTNGKAKLLLPFKGNSTQKYKFTFFGYQKKMANNTVKLFLNQDCIASTKLKPYDTKQVEIQITPKQAKKHLKYFVQNAGNAILQDGYGKDIGNTLRNIKGNPEEFYDFDSQYFYKERLLLAFCGAACLLKKKMLEEINFFDGYYFMYYEDLDMSLRAWKRGWNIVFAPKAVIYHQHRATTGKSPSGFFINLIERNHLSFLLTHFPLKIFAIEFILFTLRLIVNSLILFSFKFRENIVKEGYWGTRVNGRKDAMLYILKNLKRLYLNRKKGQKNEVRSYSNFSKFLY